MKHGRFEHHQPNNAAEAGLPATARLAILLVLAHFVALLLKCGESY